MRRCRSSGCTCRSRGQPRPRPVRVRTISGSVYLLDPRSMTALRLPAEAAALNPGSGRDVVRTRPRMRARQTARAPNGRSSFRWSTAVPSPVAEARLTVVNGRGDDPHAPGASYARGLLVPRKEVEMAGTAPRTISADLTRFTSAGFGTVHGVAGLAVGGRVRVVDEDSDVLEAEVLAAHADGSAELRVHWNRGKERAYPPMPVPGRSSVRHSTTGTSERDRDDRRRRARSARAPAPRGRHQQRALRRRRRRRDPPRSATSCSCATSTASW